MVFNNTFSRTSIAAIFAALSVHPLAPLLPLQLRVHRIIE
jgi:hypothetical protein